MDKLRAYFSKPANVITVVFLAVLLLAFLSCPLAWGKSGDEHRRDWNAAFGIVDGASREAIRPLWDAAQDVIDGYQGDYRDLCEHFKWFNVGSYGHRLLFHWGFNTDPRRHQPLARQVQRCLAEAAQKLPPPEARAFRETQEREFFKYLAQGIQARRNKRLITAVTQTTGIPTARGYANAVATILYDVHLLGDHTTSAVSGLPSLDALQRDLVENGFRRLLAGGDKTERLQKIDEELKAAIRTGRGRVNKKRAELLLAATRRLLPPLLNERFEGTLKGKGITVTEPPLDGTI